MNEQNAIPFWREAQEDELHFWRASQKKRVSIPHESRARCQKCLTLSPILIDYSTRILDVGSGPYGGVPFFLSTSCFKVSIDPVFGKTGEFLKKGLGEDINITQAVGESLPFIPDAFDLVFCINTLDHSYNPLTILKEIHRVLSKSGVLVMMVHVVTPIEKLLHHLVYKTRLRRASKAVARLAGIIGSNILKDGIKHPFYFTHNDVVELLSHSGFSTIQTNCYASEWNYKKECYIVSCKKRNTFVKRK